MKRILSFSLVVALCASLVPMQTLQATKHESIKWNVAKLIAGSGCVGASILSGLACTGLIFGAKATASAAGHAPSEAQAGIALFTSIFFSAGSLAAGAICATTGAAATLLLNDSIRGLKYHYNHRAN